MTLPPPLDIDNVQGDILEGLPKKAELFFFFTIDPNPNLIKDFRAQLVELVPHITSAKDCQEDRKRIADEKKEAADEHRERQLLEISAINIAFSHKGLEHLQIGESVELGDAPFQAGMRASADTRLRDNLEEWKEAFKKDDKPIHGVFLVTGESRNRIEKAFGKVKKIFSIGKEGATIKEVISIFGNVRPGDEQAHEHFGFMDGISQPAIKDYSPPLLPGQEQINQGIILCGREKDDGVVVPGNNPIPVTRPPWALDGSFLTFRHLKQLVPEFNRFLERHPLEVLVPNSSDDPTGAELLGARLVGRWKSGAPIDVSPLRDDPALAEDPLRNNDFTYDPLRQDRCPFAAHTRKTNPRADLASVGGSEIRRILRRGIQFGPEVTPREATAKTSSKDLRLERGLLFVCYQSNIANGFEFIQESWANNPGFPFGKGTAKPPITAPGFDPLIGRTPTTDPRRNLVGHIPDPAFATDSLSLNANWVIPQGGEYFFSPSISALRDTLAQKKTTGATFGAEL